MANVTISHGEVKNICNELERSPSKDNMKTSPIYHPGGTATSGPKTAGFKAPPSKTGPKKNSKDPFTTGHQSSDKKHGKKY